MQIKINLKIFLFLIIFIITKQIKIYAILMIFAFIHELAHIIMGILLGFKPEAISIIPTGFSVKFKAKYENYNIKIKKGNLLSIKKILIASAGPLTNVIIPILIFVYYKVTGNTYIINIPLDLIIYSNILIFIFNLIPIYPLDGGRILKEIIHIYSGIHQSYIITNKVSNVSAIILTVISSVIILIYKNIAILFIIIYLWILVINENKEFAIKMKIWNQYKKLTGKNGENKVDRSIEKNII